MENFEHKKSLGQNFLNSDYVPKQMCDAASITAGESVVEIGPGTGALTKELLKRGAQVIAVEADQRALAVLKETFEAEVLTGALVLHHLDARTLDLATLGVTDHDFKIVANIPYYLSGLLLRRCLETDCQPSHLVFLMQKELVERIARADKESLLSLSVKVFGIPHYVTTIKRGHFTPAPKVDSAILSVSEISRKHFTDFSSETFFTILQLGFGSKRKQLAGNLSKEFEKELILQAFHSAEIPEKVRAEDVPLTNWLELVTELAVHDSKKRV